MLINKRIMSLLLACGPYCDESFNRSLSTCTQPIRNTELRFDLVCRLACRDLLCDPDIVICKTLGGV